jgi:glycosyltransferase involved in cell wall biosynthesis/ribosomal protein S18 acetylase RimI-like enzyme
VRIAWFTPYAARSAIAEYSEHVTRALAEHASVELWMADEEDRRATEFPLVHFGRGPLPLDRLSRYDAIFYNIGDHLGFHGAIYDASREVPGIVILHDRICHNLFFNYWISRGRPDRYVDLMENFYGDVGRAAAEASFAGMRSPVWSSDEDLVRFPLFEEALVGARGVVVHSESHAAQVRNVWYGPIASLWLPAYRPSGQVRHSLKPNEGRVSVVTLGYVNPNKQIDRVVRLLARNPGLADRVRYLVVGPYDPGSAYWSELRNLVWRSGLESVVELMGYQPDDVVVSVLEEADVCINLRWPSFEGASASLMQQLELGKPVLAIDAAGFAELPENALVKIPTGDDEALERALVRLVEDEAFRRDVGAEAKAAAGERKPERYAAALIQLLEEVEAWEPMLDLADRVALELGILGYGDQLQAADDAARELSAFTGTGEELVDRVAIRPLELGDEKPLTRFFIRNAVPEVTTRFDPFPLTTETARKIALEPRRDCYYGAFLGGRLVGMSMLRGWDEGFEVPSFGVVVDPEFAGKGIGGRLIDFAIAEAARLGSPSVRLSVYASNPLARAMYERRGFEELERRAIERDGSRDERIVMMKALRET